MGRLYDFVIFAKPWGLIKYQTDVKYGKILIEYYKCDSIKVFHKFNYFSCVKLSLYSFLITSKFLNHFSTILCIPSSIFLKKSARSYGWFYFFYTFLLVRSKSTTGLCKCLQMPKPDLMWVQFLIKTWFQINDIKLRIWRIISSKAWFKLGPVFFSKTNFQSGSDCKTWSQSGSSFE